jgi:hypothetical protein
MIRKSDPDFKERFTKCSREESDKCLAGLQEAMNQLFYKLRESNFELPLLIEVTTDNGSFMRYKITEDKVEALFETMGDLVMPPFKFQVTDAKGNKAEGDMIFHSSPPAS